MRKVVLGGANSLDNYLARPDHSVDWLLWGEEVAAITAAFLPPSTRSSWAERHTKSLRRMDRRTAIRGLRTSSSHARWGSCRRVSSSSDRPRARGMPAVHERLRVRAVPRKDV